MSQIFTFVSDEVGPSLNPASRMQLRSIVAGYRLAIATPRHQIPKIAWSYWRV